MSHASPHLDESWRKLWERLKSLKGKYERRNITLSKLLSQGDLSFILKKLLNRKLYQQFVACVLGMPVHLAKIRVRDHSLCECGLDDGSLSHIFFSCLKLIRPLYYMLPYNVPRPLNVQCLLMFMFSPLCKFVCKYITNIKIKL